ncbi:MAG: YtxH domain-containing protein [Proteiniphilum sp.]|jgi:hypothetical protein
MNDPSLDKSKYSPLNAKIMKSEAKLLLGLGIGIALGAAVGYIMGTDKKEEWLEQANEFADKIKANVKSAVYKGKSEVEDLKEDIDDIAEIAKKELAKQ